MKKRSNSHQKDASLNMYTASLIVSSGTFLISEALDYLFRAHSVLGDSNPALHLSIGVVYLNMVLTKSNLHRTSTLLRAFTFLFHYYNTSNKSQEACYNLGRAFHQMGMNYLAVPFYQSAMKMSAPIRRQDHQQAPPTGEEPTCVIGTSDDEECRNLKRDAAYNLHLIYKQNGNKELALKMLEYIVF